MDRQDIRLILTIDPRIQLNCIDILQKFKVEKLRVAVSRFEIKYLEKLEKFFQEFRGGIHLDLQGNEKGRIIETKNMIESGSRYGRYIPLKKGDEIIFCRKKNDCVVNSKCVFGTIFPDVLEANDILYISDDEITGKLIRKEKNKIFFKILSIRNVNGIYPSLGFTSPGKSLVSGINKLISSKDKEFLKFFNMNIASYKLKEISFSFIENTKDIQIALDLVRKFENVSLCRPVIVFKIETIAAYNNIKELSKCLSRMKEFACKIEIARGDLSVNCRHFGLDIENIQNTLIQYLNKYKIEYIIATHVFDSAITQIKNNQRIELSKKEREKLLKEIRSGAKEFMLAGEGGIASTSAKNLQDLLYAVKIAFNN